MVELVDTRDLKSLALNRRAGSIPALRTNLDYKIASDRGLFLFIENIFMIFMIDKFY
jgi:hypothetical protein